MPSAPGKYRLVIFGVDHKTFQTWGHHRPTSKGPLIKQRPKSAHVITDAYAQNLKEEKCLFVKLDGLHYQHHAGLIRWRQVMSVEEQKRYDLLVQRAVTPHSTLDHVMDQIQTLKRHKRSTGNTRSSLPASTELDIGLCPYSKWPPSTPFMSRLSVTGPGDRVENGGGKPFNFTRTDGAFPAIDKPQTKPHEFPFRTPEISEKTAVAKSWEASQWQRKPKCTMESLSYRELGGIALLENISMRETEKQKQQKVFERQNLNKTHETALQHKIHSFLKKFE
ncbi:uncharacterized protein RCH25_044068 [Pelodytes ibericus]